MFLKEEQWLVNFTAFCAGGINLYPSHRVLYMCNIHNSEDSRERTDLCDSIWMPHISDTKSHAGGCIRGSQLQSPTILGGLHQSSRTWLTLFPSPRSSKLPSHIILRGSAAPISQNVKGRCSHLPKPDKCSSVKNILRWYHFMIMQ